MIKWIKNKLAKRLAKWAIYELGAGSCTHRWTKVYSRFKKVNTKSRSGFIITTDNVCEICRDWKTTVKDTTKKKKDWEIKNDVMMDNFLSDINSKRKRYTDE